MTRCVKVVAVDFEQSLGQPVTDNNKTNNNNNHSHIEQTQKNKSRERQPTA